MEESIKRKIEEVGTPLRDWNVRINYGIKTGYNEAFIISGAKKDELIAQDPKSAEIIRPILRGKDIHRYGYSFSDKWLIVAHNGNKDKKIPPIDIEKYPAIKLHLDKFFPQIARRYDKGYTPYNLRNCVYMDVFNKQKIAWGEISDRSKFCYVPENVFLDVTTFLMVGERLPYLLATLNSKLAEWMFNKIGTTTGVGTNRWKKYKLESLNIKIPSTQEEEAITNIINKHNFSIDYCHIHEIDNIIYRIYNLSMEEIKFVENFMK